jgi:hypothetical protein
MSDRKDWLTQADDVLAAKQQQEWVDHGGDIQIKCSGCDLHLVSLVVTRTDAPVSNEVVAKCCHCGDKSFIQKVKGMFAYGAVAGTQIANINIVDQEMREDQIFMKIEIETRGT